MSRRNESGANRPWRRALAVCAGLIVACLGCGREPAGQPKLLLYCGAGIRPPVAELAEEFGRTQGATVEVDYAGSEVLLSRVKLTRRGDLYMPGDVSYLRQAEQEGLVTEQTTVCYFVPVIMVPRGNPRGIRTLEDLSAEGVRVGLGDAKACAIGRICVDIFDKNKIPAEKIERNVVFRSLTVDELGNQIKLGTLDATIVWDAVARRTAEADVVSIPPARNVVSTIAIGLLAGCEQADLARRFVAAITSAEGQKVFEKHRFTTRLEAAP